MSISSGAVLRVSSFQTIKKGMWKRKGECEHTQPRDDGAAVDINDRPHSIMQGDGNFTQKRMAEGEDDLLDGERTHPRTVFISPETLKRMEKEVEKARAVPVKRKPTKKTAKAEAEGGDDEWIDDDGFEGKMKVPESVLSGCESSFTAASEKREKASTQFFSDTGLMALLCRHDQVIFLANMKSAGEKQYYMLALLEEVFKLLPDDWWVGVLYDIGCQTHRSLEKWGLLPKYSERIMWAISVFHAYGHQWACQLVYHPRKCKGFGLTDGEGCERFWSSIRHLISGLRVSGVSGSLVSLLSH